MSYTKQTWANGDIITAAKLNHMEDGIAGVEADVSSLDTQLLASMPHDTASGSIASFPDGAAMPVRDLSVAIEPVQAGSGDPSPTNIRPISGWTECKVTRAGKNLWNPSFFTDNGFTENGGVYSGSSSDLNGVVLSIPPTDRAVMSLEYKGATTSRAGYFKFVYSDGSNNYPIDCKEDVWTTKTAVSTSGKTVIGIIFGRSNAVNMEVRNFQLELSSTASSYEEFQGATYTIDLNGTRYGGTLDVTTGKLTVTDGYIASYDGETLPSTWISDRDVYAAGTNPTNGAEVVYKLATPIVIDLTPTEVSTLLGTNNIFADCGGTTVDYYADTTLFVNKKIAAAVAALS